MLFNIILFCAIIYCNALSTFPKSTVSDKDKNAVIETYTTNEGERGTYYSYQTSNDIGQEQVFLTKDEQGNDKFEIRGSYNYIDTDGEHVVVHYEADENGFRIVQPVQSRIGGPVLASLAG